MEKAKKKNMVLLEVDRKVLINHVHAYLDHKCKIIERQHLVQVAKTLVFIMPGLTDSNGGEHAGYVSLYSKNAFFYV